MSQATAGDLPRIPRRDPIAEQQITDARAYPTSAEIEAQMQDAELRTCDAYFGIDPTPPDSLTLSGAKLAAYRQLELAAGAAHAAQDAMATTGAQLREAIQALCAAIAPGAK